MLTKTLMTNFRGIFQQGGSLNLKTLSFIYYLLLLQTVLVFHIQPHTILHHFPHIHTEHSHTYNVFI